MKKPTLCKELPRRSDIQKVELGQKYVRLGAPDSSANLVTLPPPSNSTAGNGIWEIGSAGSKEQNAEQHLHFVMSLRKV
jgi:hypothetical protein